MADQPKHTPGPWTGGIRQRWSDGNERTWIGTYVGYVICEVFHERNVDSEANARRIIACVNACEGIPTADLAHAAHATQVLPELIAALRLIQNMSIDKEDDARWTWRDICLECERVTRAAIASATAQPQPLRDDERAEVLKSASSA
jgi:hypothetical protein